MNDIFVDGIRSIAVANGVARIELLQLRRGESKNKLDPEVVGVLMLPIASLTKSSQVAFWPRSTTVVPTASELDRP